MDMLPVDRDHAEHLMLGTDEITVLATGDQTGGAILAVEIRAASSPSTWANPMDPSVASSPAPETW